jgi:sterol 14-demethylase
MTTAVEQREPPRVSGGEESNGHLDELRFDPIALLNRVRAECGDVGVFRLAQRDVVLLSGADANEFFFRAPEEILDQAEAYPFMTPIFGEGVVFDASPERRREMLHNQALRDKFMRGHASTIADEVAHMVAGWADHGEIDLLDWFAELTIYTSSACLVGKRFRHELDKRFAQLYHDLEQGTDAIAYVDPYAPIESFRRRDAARVGLVQLVEGIMERRAAAPPSGDDERDLLDVLMSITNEDGTPRFAADEVTGMFISMMFAGHHTTSGTAAWTLIELLRHPEDLDAVHRELGELYAGGAEVSYQALRAMPRLESAVKEALRLHPPLILLLRVAKEDLEVDGFAIRAGQMVGASPSVSNRIPEDFPDADSFQPARYLEPREEDRSNPWTWIPFGAGRHRCVGAAFAMMQLKAIFSVLLSDWEFELAQPSDTYRNDHSKMVVQLQQPCVVRYRRRRGAPSRSGTGAGAGDARSAG